MFHFLEYLVQYQCCLDSAKHVRVSSSVELRRLVWLGPLTVLACIGGALSVRFLAIAVLHPESGFLPLSLALTIVDTAVLVSLGVWVFKRVASLALDPIVTFKTIALKALLLSLLPEIAVGLSNRPTASWLNAFALMAEHVVAWAVCVQMLTRLSRT